MKRILGIWALSILMLAVAASAQAEGVDSGNPGSIAVEIENQTPCFLFGGYQLSVGVRYGRFRIRASTQDSGTADFEDNGIDDHDKRFSRAYDDGSFSVNVDYFLNNYFFAYGCLASNRWLVEDKDSSAGDHLSTLDAGLGLGLQYVFYKGLFIQLSGQVNFRERQSLMIQGREYTVPGIDYSPGLRLGYRFK